MTPESNNLKLLALLLCLAPASLQAGLLVLVSESESLTAVSAKTFIGYSRQRAMASVAAPYFGQNSGKLILAPVKEGSVDIGALRSLGPVPSTELR